MTRVGKLEGVVHQVGYNLHHTSVVGSNIYCRGVLIKDYIYIRLVVLASCYCRRLIKEISDIYLGVVQLYHSSLNLREVEHIIDKLQQEFVVLLDDIDIALSVLIISCTCQDL